MFSYIEEQILEFIYKYIIGLVYDDADTKKIDEFLNKVTGYNLVGGFTVSDLVVLILIIAAIAYFYRLRYSMSKLLDEIFIKSKEIKGILPFEYEKNGDGDMYYVTLNDNVRVSKMKGTQLNLQPSLTIPVDKNLLQKLMEVTVPYKEGLSKNPFKRLAVDNTEIQGLIDELRNELRLITLNRYEGMSDEERQLLVFKYAVLVTCNDILDGYHNVQIRELRSVRSVYEERNQRVTNYLLDSSDSNRVATRIKKLEEKLQVIEWLILKTILAESYFQAIGMVHETRVDGVEYLHLPIQMQKDKSMILLIILADSVNTNPNFKDLKKDIKKTIRKHRFGIKMRGFLEFCFKKK